LKQLAVIGSGIAGMAAAYYLSRKHTVVLFEKENRIGGHTHTISVPTESGVVPVDTGFIVHNNRTYPNLIRLFRELGVATQDSDMSFSVSCGNTGLEYSSRGANGFFAQRKNLLRLAHFGLFKEILRFNRQAPKLLAAPDPESISLGEYLERGRYTSTFRDFYLYPMASAVWSTSLAKMSEFPAATLIRFFDNHGMLSLNREPKWKVLRGGSSSYIRPLTAPYRERIRTRVDIRSVRRRDNGVELEFAAGHSEWFDEVVFACHGNQALSLLAQPTPAELDVLQHFRTSRNETVLHTDENLLSRNARVRASWNYHLNGHCNGGATMTYHMNRLQSLRVPEQFCVTLNSNDHVRPEKVVRRLTYSHPLYTREAIAAQKRWNEISGKNRTHFCGAYWFYGFHEDGLNSAMRVARAGGVDC